MGAKPRAIEIISNLQDEVSVTHHLGMTR